MLGVDAVELEGVGLEGSERGGEQFDVVLGVEEDVLGSDVLVGPVEGVEVVDGVDEGVEEVEDLRFREGCRLFLLEGDETWE